MIAIWRSKQPTLAVRVTTSLLFLAAAIAPVFVVDHFIYHTYTPQGIYVDPSWHMWLPAACGFIAALLVSARRRTTSTSPPAPRQST
jgi:hypothetical protein